MMSAILKEIIKNKRQEVVEKYSHVKPWLLEEYIFEEIAKNTESLSKLTSDMVALQNYPFNDIEALYKIAEVLEELEAIEEEAQRIQRRVKGYAEDAFVLGFLSEEDLFYFMSRVCN